MPLRQSLFKAVEKESLLSLSDQAPEQAGAQIGNALGYTQQALAGDMESAVKAATAALANAKSALENGNSAAARELFGQAFFLDQAAANVGASDGTTAATALAALEKLHSEQVKAWSKDLPALGTKLNLVLRDRSLEEAINQVADAAGLSISIVRGSLDDAAALSGEKELRIMYLDLRRATVAEALDWLLMPERLSWSRSKDGISVASDRRRAGRSAWVYDVSQIAIPDGAELEKLGDGQKALAAAQKETEEFRNVVRSAVSAKADDSSVVWFAPGQLLVIGTPEGHAKTDKLLSDLTDSKARLTGAAAALHTRTAKRFVDRQAHAKKLATARALLQVARVHDQSGWQLLARAAAGSLDLEALTELQIAWRRPETAQLLKGEGRAIVLRSWWIVNEVNGALDGQSEELAALVESTRRACQSAIDEAMAALEKSPNDGSAFAAVMYSALARRDEPFSGKVLSLLSKPADKDDSLAAARTIAKALLAERKALDAEALSQLVGQGVAGEDLTVLLALACKRGGDQTWNAYRAAAGDLVGGQPLDGNVVILLNRLVDASLPLLAQRE